jgi:hypothetical protein
MTTGARVNGPEVDERLIALCDPDFLPAAELPTSELSTWWHQASWDDVQVAITRGKVAILACESHEVMAATTAALFACGGNLLFRFDPGKARLYLRAAPREREEQDGRAGGEGETASKIGEVILIGLDSIVSRLDTEQIFAAVRYLAETVAFPMLPDVEAHEEDRPYLIATLKELLCKLSTKAALAVKEKLAEYANDAEDDGE